MNETELLAILARGEDSRHQFKENISNVDSLAAELVAFANSGGGTLIVGANDAGTPPWSRPSHRSPGECSRSAPLTNRPPA